MTNLAVDLATQSLLQKNERIRERHGRLIKQINQDESRISDQLDRQLHDLRVEIRAAQAYKVVYSENNLSSIYGKRKNEQAKLHRRMNTRTEDPKLQKRHPSADPRQRSSRSTKLTVNLPRDPFRVQSCLLDVENDREPKTVVFPKLDDTNSKPGPTARKRLRRVKTAPVRRVGTDSLLPGNCTSYYSIRRYYDQEKDKVLVRWSPQERRKQTVKIILENMNLKETGLSLTESTVQLATGKTNTGDI